MADLISPADMVRVKGIAPFEAQYAFAAWVEAMQAEAKAQGADLDRQGEDDPSIIVTADVCGGFGPPWPLLGERPTDFGLRAAAALFHFIKES